jgi:methyl coenzyme M reductase beta subunit
MGAAPQFYAALPGSSVSDSPEPVGFSFSSAADYSGGTVADFHGLHIPQAV